MLVVATFDGVEVEEGPWWWWGGARAAGGGVVLWVLVVSLLLLLSFLWYTVNGICVGGVRTML